MNNKIKSGILSGILIGSAFMVSSCHINGGKAEETPVASEAYEISDERDSMNYDLYGNDMEYLGQVVVSPNIFDILNDKGYSINQYGMLAEGSLESHDYAAVAISNGATTTDVNFRTGPGTEYDIIETLNNGEPVELIAKCDNGWYLLQNKGRLGFVRGDYIHAIDEAFIASQLENLPELVPVVRATADVNVRPESNIDNTPYGLLNQGEYLPVRRTLENGWYEVEYEGKIAYVSEYYVEESYALSGDFTKFVALNQNTKLYERPYGNAVADLPQFEACKVFGEVDEFYYVDCNGQIGFVPKNNCESLNGTYVIVDISEQRMTLYQDGKILLSSECVTGQDSMPSDLGLFDIDWKTTDTYLTGPGYSSHVDYWMPYNGGEGLHDASWRSVFGGEIYHSSGSHGCINLPVNVARSVYEKIHVGDKVLVKE